MTTALFLVALVVGAIVLMSFIPGLQPFVKPLVDILFTLVKVVAENATAWTVFTVKRVWFAHLELVKHLLLSAEQIDPSVALREQEQ